MGLKKGLFFTVDSIFAATIIITGILLLHSFYTVEPSRAINDYISQDLISALSTLTISEVNNSYVDELISSGEIKNSKNTILEQIGEFWALDKKEIAFALIKEFSENFIEERFGFSFSINGEELYVRNKTNTGVVVSSKRMISGIKENRTREGFIARAMAIRIIKNTTEVFMINPLGSSHGPGNTAYITKKFYINSSNIINATLFMTVHWGTSDIHSNKFYINNQVIEIGVPWIYEQEKNKTHIGFDIVDIKEYVNEGWNELKIVLNTQSEGHTHIHPGSRIEVEYESEVKYSLLDRVKKRIYFDNILSVKGNNPPKGVGAWQVLPVFIPKETTIKNAVLHVVGKNIESFPIPDGVDEKANVQIYLGEEKIDMLNVTGLLNVSYDLKDKLKEGTNVISVYLNCYPDYFFGKGETTLYSDPENDPGDSSYVDIEYEIQKLKYGTIDVSRLEQFSGAMSINKSHTKDFGDYRTIEAFIQPSQLDSLKLYVKANDNYVFITPKPPLATPSSIYVDSDYLIDGENLFTLWEGCSDCYILNETTLQYHILVPSLVGYGKVFDTKEEALNDANERLNKALGSYVNAIEIMGEVNSVSGVPSLWGPLIVEGKTWY